MHTVRRIYEFLPVKNHLSAHSHMLISTLLRQKIENPEQLVDVEQPVLENTSTPEKSKEIENEPEVEPRYDDINEDQFFGTEESED